MEQKIVLIIPDASQGNSSGAIVCQVAVKLCVELGYKVIVYSDDLKDDSTSSGIVFIKRPPFSAKADYLPSSYLRHFQKVIRDYCVSTVFFIGSITNKPLCYLEESIRRGLHVCVKIFMQDFFCSKFYANDEEGVCIKCLDKFGYAIRNNCCGRGFKNKLITLNRIHIRKRLKALLPNVDYVITSSNEQIGFYKRFGIAANKCIKTPLYFSGERFRNVPTEFGDYYVGIAQHRIEKGFHLLPRILKYCGKNVKVVLAYANDRQVEIAKKNNGFKPYIDSGQLEIISSSWNSGLMNLVANAKGVIIPSIWPTTTEFGLLESLALGKCVFCFDLGIHSEIIKYGINGFAFPINNNEDFGNKLTTFNDDEYSVMSHTINELYLSLTDWEGWIKTLKEIL